MTISMNGLGRFTLASLVVSLFTFQVGVANAQSGAATPDQVKLSERGHGWILTDADGMTLYTFLRDQLYGSSECYDECLETWQPLIAPEGAEAKGEDWTISEREDGKNQWAFLGKPLYTFNNDTSPGEMNGDEFQQEWNAALKPLPLPPGFSVLKTPDGHLLVDQQNRTLYTSEADQAGVSECNNGCARTWIPVEAWSLADSKLDDWSVIDRADGTKQWAYDGKPLYRYAKDYASGDLAGHGVDNRQAVVLEPPPPNPEWVTVQQSDGGELLAMPNGQTIYRHNIFRNAFFARMMARPDFWDPVYADEDDKSIGNWSIVTLEDGKRQWTYKGLKLYVNKNDKVPGDINGIRSIDRVWAPIMTNGKTMPGSGQ